MAIVGVIFACVPGALIIGWVLLPVSLVLGVIGAVQKDSPKGTSIAAIVVAIVGGGVAAVVAIALVGNAVGKAISAAAPSASTSVSAEATTDATTDSQRNDPDTGASGEDTDNPDDSDAAGETSADRGTSRDTPAPIGTKLTTDDWKITVKKVTLDADKQVAKANMFNDEPKKGSVYILVYVTATYTGDDDQGSIPWVSVDYITADGTTISGTDSLAVAPKAFNRIDAVYPGGSVKGNFVLEVPKKGVGDGVLAITPQLFADKVFIAVK
ncbi:hypothetical protein GCM10010407_04340 [Rarobacter incanus]